MLRRFLVALLVFGLVPVLAIAKPGTVKGKITINGKAKDLKYVYAYKDGANTTVLLTDSKLDDAVIGDRFGLMKLAKEDKFTGVQVTITPKGDIPTGTFYTAAEDGYFDAMGMHEWKKKTQTATDIAGTLSIDKEHKFFKTTYSYTAEFDTPIGPAPKKK
jgi:hypothetical protein